MKEKLSRLMSEYGGLAVGIYLLIFAGSLVAFAAAIRSGVEVEGVAGTAGLWGGAWLATKLTQPLRIGATVVLTPLVALVFRRGSRREAADTPGHGPQK